MRAVTRNTDVAGKSMDFYLKLLFKHVKPFNNHSFIGINPYRFILYR